MKCLKRTLIIILVFFTIISCDDNTFRDKIRINSFPIEYKLHGEEIPEIDNNFYPLLMGLHDSILVFCDTENQPHFHIYRVPDFTYLGNFGAQGFGPSDIHDPVFWGQFQIINNKTKMWVYQMNLMKFNLIDIEMYLTQETNEPERTVVMPPEAGVAVNIIALNDSTFVGSGSEAFGEFFIYNSSSDEMVWKPFITAFDMEYTEMLTRIGLIEEYKLGVIKIKPDQTKFVKSYLYAPIIDVYDSETNILFSICTRTPKKVDINSSINQFRGGTSLYYINTFLTNSFIYAVNINCTLDEFNNDQCNNVEVEVFDWNGKPICKYQLNESITPTGAMVVDENNSVIYTINPKSEFDIYSSFKISKSYNVKAE